MEREQRPGNSKGDQAFALQYRASHRPGGLLV